MAKKVGKMPWYDPINPKKNYQNLARDYQSGNKWRAAFGTAGRALRLPEMGVSELFKAKPAQAETIKRGNYSIRGKVNADGKTIGFDYFLNGQPITETEYAASGMNLAGDQALAAKDLTINEQNNALNTPTSSGGGTTGTSSTEPFGGSYYNGVYYTDPEAYKTAVTNDINANYNQQKASLDRQYDSGLISYDARQQQLNKARKDAMTGISSYFGAISPEAYQSTQGGLENEAQQTYQTNTTNLGREEQDWTAGVLDQITALKSDFMNSLDTLANQVAPYSTNPMGTFAANDAVSQTPQSVLDQFSKYNLTKQLYGNALPVIKKAKSSYKNKVVNPLASYMYPEEIYQ